MSNKYNTEDIVRFINGYMNAIDADAFKQAMQTDAWLIDEVAAQQKMSRLVQIASIKNHLDSVHHVYTSEKDIPSADTVRLKPKYVWRWLAAAAIIAGIGIFLFLYRSAPSINDKLFAAYFYDDAGMPSLMGNSTTPFDDAMVYYKAADYKQAAFKFDKLLSVSPKNDSLKYYEALCQVRLRNDDKAIQLLSAVAETPGSELYIKAKWYTALVLIRQKKSTEAILILEKVKNTESTYAKNAAKLLTDLKADKTRP